MGSLVSCARLPHTIEMKGRIRIVHSGGLESEYMAPLSAKDVLLEHPQHSIFDAGNLQSGDLHPISEKEELLPGRVYFVVHLNALQSQDLVSMASKLMDYDEVSGQSAVEIDETAQETESTEYLERVLGTGRFQDFRNSKQMGICDTAEMRMAYVNHLLNKDRSMSWRPGLDTIHERSFFS